MTAYRTDARSTIVAHYLAAEDEWHFVCAYCDADAQTDTEGSRYCTCPATAREREARNPPQPTRA